MSGLRNDLLALGAEARVTLAGAATSLGTVGAVLVGILVFGVDFSSMSVWLVVPIGAIGAGMLAASGYFRTAGELKEPPGGVMLLNMVLIAITTFGLIQYSQFYSAALTNPEWRAVGFWQYYMMSVTHKELVFRHALHQSYSGLGNAAWVLEATRLCGFIAGAVVAYHDLRRRATDPVAGSAAADQLPDTSCDRCGVPLYSRTFASMVGAEIVEDYIAARGIENSALADSFRQHRSAAQPGLAFSLRLATCGVCARDQVILMVHDSQRSRQAAVQAIPA
jgi:hypothetical protein